MRQQHILFDLDDTLIHCNKYFGLALGQFFEILQDWFGEDLLPTEDIRRKQIEIDVLEVQSTGFKSDNFPRSLIATYHHFSMKYSRPIDPSEERLLTELGMSVYEQEVEAYPGMVETLDNLQQQGHELYLYTGGETAIQQRKIDQMKLDAYFNDRIFIRQHKTTEALEQILKKGRFDRSVTWMIGNSLRTDILPAMTAGIAGIYIQQPDEWEYNIVELKHKPHNELYTVSALTEVPSVVEDKITNNTKQRT